MRTLALLFAKMCQYVSAFFGRLGIAAEAWYYSLTEMGRA